MLVKNLNKLPQIFSRLRLVKGLTANSTDRPINVTTNVKQRSGGLPSLLFANSRKHYNDQHEQHNSHQQDKRSPLPHHGLVLTVAFSFNFFGIKDADPEDTPETKLINTIKRSILCIQKQQYEKAEQMLHLSLRMAQDLQSSNGITYVYDLMANLAMEQQQYKKAEKIFVDVMKRLMTDGHGEDSPKILHISSKIAHMSQLQGDLEKSFQGFTWTLQRLTKLIGSMPDDNDVLELYGLTKNWFGQLLMKQGKYAEAKNLFKEALDILVGVYGKLNEATVTILNNISVAYVNLEKYGEAKDTLLKALEIAKELNDGDQEGVIQANLGLVYLREGLPKEAEKFCKVAWKLGKSQKNADAIEQAEYCLNEIKSSLSA